MKTRHFFLSVFAIVVLFFIAFSNILLSTDEITTKYQHTQSYLYPDSSGDTTDGNGGGPKIPPTGN